MALPRRRRDELATGVQDEVPYDRTGLSVGSIGEAQEPQVGLGQLGEEAPLDAAPGEVLPMASGETPDMAGDLAALDEAPDLGGEEDLMVQEMAAALEDPNVPPEDKAMIEQELALAARRRLAGV